MSALVTAQGLTKRYGSTVAVNDVSFEIERGRIIGLIGPNGAGKTTLLNAMLGLTPFDGALTVLGLDPFRQRKALMQRISYVADVAVLPKWITVEQLLEFVGTVHSNYSEAKAHEFLAKTKIGRSAKVGSLSKGMVTQLHLAIIMAIDAELLVLDEPTIGLDILFRKDFYSRLLEDYYDGEKTIVVTTHQVEEIEHILTDLMFIDDGRLVLHDSIESVQGRFVELMVGRDKADEARAHRPIYEREVFGKAVLLFEDVSPDKLAAFGEIRTPAIADLFVAKIRGQAA